MKKFNIFLMLAMLLAACTPRIEDVFDQSSAIRIREEIARTAEVLTGAQNGWVMEYYAATKYGGYNVICKFSDDNTVTVQNELFGEQTATSHYKIDQSQGVVLSFDEYNELFHYFSTPSNPDGVGSNGDGMLGDFEFRVLSVNADEVMLEGKKHGSRITMKPLAKDVEWNVYLADVTEMESNMAASFYNLHLGDITVTASASYRMLSFTDAESGNAINIPFIYTPEGYKFYKELDYAGKKVSELKYSAEDGNCYADDKSVYIEVRPVPLSEAITSSPWYFSGADGSMSAATLEKFLECKAGSAGEKENIGFMYLGTGLTAATQSKWGVGFISGNYYGMLFFSGTAVDDNTITIKYTGHDGGNGQWYMQNAGYSVLTTVLGSTFKLSTDNQRNPSYIKMEDTANAGNWMILYAAEVNLPFGEYDK